MAREKVHASATARKAAYRDRNKVLVDDVRQLLVAFGRAADAAGLHVLVDGLSEDPHKAVRELTGRLQGKAVVLFRRTPGQLRAAGIEVET